MADKTPVRVVFNESNVATGMAEFQSGDTVAVANGGTGLSSIGSAGQVLKVNAAGNGLEFGAEGDISITNLVAPTNADLTFTTSGTGNIVLDAVTLNGTTFSAADSTQITFAENVDVTGTLGVAGALSSSTSLALATGATVTGIADEDNMSSNSNTLLATQQSIKAYVDSEVGSISATSIVQNNSNITVADTGTGTITVTVDGSTIGTFNASGLQLGSSGARVTTVLDEDNLSTDSATALATQQSIKAYVDAQITAEDLDFQADSGGALSIDLDSETMTFTGGTGIDTSGSGNAVTFAIDSTVATLTGSQTLTNKVLTTPTINGATMTGNVTVDNLTLNDNIISSSSNADLILDPAGTGNVKLNAATDVTGAVTITTTTTDASLLITTTEASNSAAPVIELKRNSSSPADADYLGRLTFKGENDADQAVTYARISGKILDASDGSEDGAIEFNTIKAGSSTISARLNSDELKLLNGTSLEVSGSVTIDGDLNVTGSTTTVNTSNTTISDNIIELNTGISQSLNDAGIIIERGTTGNNAAIIWDESADKFTMGTTTATAGDKSGGITVSVSTLVANLEGNVTGNVSGSSGSSTGNAATATALETARNIAGQSFDGTGNITIASTDLSNTSAITLNTASQTLTNKTLTSPTINSPTIDSPSITNTTILGTATIGAVTTNDISANGSNAALSVASSGTGDLTLDAGGDIILDADNADVILKDDGTEFGRISRVSSDLVIKSATNNKDILFKGVDASSVITALTLDMSEAGAATFNSTIAATGLTVNSAYTLPTADGTNGQALVTDGSGTLSFGTVADASASDDSAALVISDKRITSTARTVDSFHATFQDSVLYYVVSNDHNEDCINVQKVSVCHNDSGSFISSAGLQSKASTTMTAFTTSLDNDMVRVKAASSNAVGGSLSFYKFGLGDNTSTGTSGNVIISQNADVDSASESLVSFAHGTFRGAKLFISINNTSKTEVGNVEALVVHDGSDAYIVQYGGIQSGNDPLLKLTAAISGDNVVVSAAGLETNLRVTTHAIMLKDTMVSNDGTYANAEAIAPVTISSTATEIDTLVESTNNGAVYYTVSKNASEGSYAVNEVFVALGSGEIAVAVGAYVSTKGTNQLAFTTDYKDDVENTGQLLAASTSGSNTTVSAYRINLLAK